MGGYASPRAGDLGHSLQAEAERRMRGAAAVEEEALGSTAVVGCCIARQEVAGWNCRLCCSESADPSLALVEVPDSRSRKSLV